MVKLFGYNIRSPFQKVLTEATTKALSAETSHGLFFRDKRDVYTPVDIQSYFDAYNNNDLVRGPIDDLIESALGQGYYNTVDGNKKNKEICDYFGEYFNLDELLTNIGKTVIVGGFVPVETRFGTGLDYESVIEDSVLKVVHPTTIDGQKIKVANNNAEPLTIEYFKQKGLREPLNGNDFAWFVYGRIANNPVGISYVKGIINTLNIIDSATANVDLILDRYISPVGIWKQQVGRDLESLKKAVLERLAGDDIFIGDLTPEEMAEAIVEFISIDPRVPFWEYIEYLDRRIYSYTRSNNLWYSKDATVASAETLDDIVQRHVHTVQRSIKRGVERYWFKPLIELLGDSGDVPRLNFGQEQTGLEDIQIEPFLTAGLTTFDRDGPYITREQYYAMLGQLVPNLPEFKAPPPQPQQEPTEEEPVPEEEGEVEPKEEWLVRRVHHSESSRGR